MTHTGRSIVDSALSLTLRLSLRFGLCPLRSIPLVMISLRRFTREACCVAVLCSPAVSAQNAEKPTPPKPQPPYRAWYTPPWLIGEPDLYPHMNLHASLGSKLDPHVDELHHRGIATLRWAWGLQHPKGDGDPQVFYNAVTHSRGMYSGYAVDEWLVKEGRPMDEAAEGYRRARVEFPDQFVACWVTGPGEQFIELVQDGTFDLAMIEGYQWWHNQPGEGIGYEGVIRRLQTVQAAGVLNRTIVGWGHVSPGSDGETGMTRGDLRHRVRQTQRQFPAMPGVAFMATAHPDNAETRWLICYADELSGQYYPDPDPSSSWAQVAAQEAWLESDGSTQPITEKPVVLAGTPDRASPHRLRIAFAAEELPSLGEVSRAELVMYAHEVDNNDRRVLRVFPLKARGMGDAVRESNVMDDHPTDARIFYQPGKLRFDVTQALRDRLAQPSKSPLCFLIDNVATGFDPPPQEDWSIHLSRDGDDAPFAILRIFGVPDAD